MMLDWLGQRHADQAAIEAGALIERAVEPLHDQTNRTPDLGGPATTTQLGDAVVRSIKTLAAERTP